jgi:hypothetical protein
MVEQILAFVFIVVWFCRSSNYGLGGKQREERGLRFVVVVVVAVRRITLD